MKQTRSKKYLDPHDQRFSAEHILRSWKLISEFENAVGKTKFTMTQYEKIRRYVIPVDQNSLLFITTESELSNQTFIQNTLELVEVFKKT